MDLALAGYVGIAYRSIGCCHFHGLAGYLQAVAGSGNYSGSRDALVTHAALDFAFYTDSSFGRRWQDSAIGPDDECDRVQLV